MFRMATRRLAIATSASDDQAAGRVAAQSRDGGGGGDARSEGSMGTTAARRPAPDAVTVTDMLGCLGTLGM